VSYTLPGPLVPVVATLGVEWPDVDEDDVYELGNDFFQFGSSVIDAGLTVADILGDLNRVARSETLTQLHVRWQSIQAEFFKPAFDAFTQAQRVCDDAYNAIHIYKAGLLGYLDIEVGAILLTGGVGALMDVVDGHLVRKTVDEMGQMAEGALLDLLVGKIDTLLKRPPGRPPATSPRYGERGNLRSHR
jgi:hypothetical protein